MTTVRLRLVAGMILASLTILLAGGPASAQYDPYQRYQGNRAPAPQPYVEPRRTRTPQMQPQMQPQPQPGRPTLYYTPQGYYYAPAQPYYTPNPQTWGQQQRVDPRPRERQRAVRRRPREETPAARRRVAPPAEVARPAETKPEVAEVEPDTTVAVFGDALAQQLGQGLEELFDDVAEVEVDIQAKPVSGLIRDDVHDWPKVIQEHLKSGERVSLAVLMVGINDRQSLRDGDTVHEALSPRWRELYGQRVDAVLRPLSEAKVPFVWVGMPPMKNDKAAADTAEINEIARDRVQRAGGVYVDVWPGFVDDENHYTPTGPDVAGQVTRLRASDGIHFTRAGARKVAHFANVEIKRLLDRAKEGTAVARTPEVPAVPAPPDPAAPPAGEPQPETAAALPPPAEEVAPPRPVAGPVVPLTRPEVSPGGSLAAGRPAPPNDVRLITQRALVEGIAPAPRPGRADDFSWPPKR